MTQAIEKRSGAITATEGFSEQSIEATGSTVEAILAAREKAMVEARFIVAMKRPRNWDVVRSKLLKAVERPGFADADIDRGQGKKPGSAWYKLPGYDNAEGFSIRFAEECLRTMGNLDTSSHVIWEDDRKRIIGVNVFDLETNVSIPTQITLEKTMERRYLKKGEVAISTRVTSSGKVNYILPADEAEMTKKQNSAISKAIRNGIMRLVPGDIQAECRQRILEIRHGDAAKDPDGARKKIIDAFGVLNVSPDDLEEYTGNDLNKISPAQIDHLRGLHKAIKAGEVTWKQVITEVRGEREDGGEQPKGPKKPTLDTVTASNKEKTEDIALQGLRNACIELAKQLWSENDYMTKLSALARKKGFSFTACTEEQGKELFTELGDMVAAVESEAQHDIDAQ